jgi:Xaa-Pro dipeptidase
MNQDRISSVLDLLREQGIRQMLITDMYSIYYLTGVMIDSGSRLMALLIRADGQHCFFLNQLFTAPEGLDTQVRTFSDTDDIAAIIAGFTDHGAPLGIDRKMSAGHLLALQSLGAGSAYVNTSGCVEMVRGRKDAQEQALMREASRINDLAMGELRRLIRPEITEAEVARQLDAIYRSLGAQGFSFSPIVSFGASAADPHHEPGDIPLREGDCVLFDVGCRKDHYCSDMTRTFFYRSVSSPQEEVYRLVLRANLAAEAAIRPGVRFCDVDRAARSLIQEGGYGPNFIHRLGHSIGLEVHEPGDANPINTTTLREGNIFSCEPGVYLPGRFGVRIEDLCLVVPEGVSILNSFPKELEVIP